MDNFKVGVMFAVHDLNLYVQIDLWKLSSCYLVVRVFTFSLMVMSNEPLDLDCRMFFKCLQLQYDDFVELHPVLIGLCI
jgi:hypothetical protein